MKKTAIALAAAAMTLGTVTVAQAAPDANTFYVGARAGWAGVHHGVGHFKSGGWNSTQKNFVTYGVYGGYQIFDYLAVELGYDDYGRLKMKSDPSDPAKQKQAKSKMTNHGANLSLKASAPLIPSTWFNGLFDGVDGYVRVGAALIRTDYKGKAFKDGDRGHKLQVSPLIGAGVEYAFIPELALRLEYTYIPKVGSWRGNGDRFPNNFHKGQTHKFKPDIHQVTLGLSYRFGQNKPQVETVNEKINLDTEVLFGFDSSKLKSEGQQLIDSKYDEVNNRMSNVNGVNVNGYTDRIGSQEYNLKLSQKRAESVANYLVSKGTDQSLVTATGYGKDNPVTGNKCDNVKGRKQLISCLAPDRRVEVVVQGEKNKKVVM